MPRPAHWPTQAQLEKDRHQHNLRLGPFPFNCGFCRYVKQTDGSYREELIYFSITRARTRDEEGIRYSDLFPIVSSEFGRTFKVVPEGESYDEAMLTPEDFAYVYLKET